MNKFQRYLSIFTSTLLFVCFIGTATAIAESPGVEGTASDQPAADVKIGIHGIGWTPKVEYKSMTLSVSVPDGTVFRKTFKRGDSLYLDMSDNNGNFPNGVYTYELLVETVQGKKKGSAENRNNEGILPWKSLTQTGYFSVQRGGFVTDAAAAEGIAKPQDVLHYDDVIITGSLCVGFDCVDGENFSFDTIRLKENNLRIHFDDTSSLSGYPANDWRIVINDSTSGGASYFRVEDSTGSKNPFTIEAGAPNNSLYVEDYGRVGIKTSTPVVELHIKDSDTPTVRLEQDSSGGWTAQTWDVAGNESNFFVRDATNGSKLPFRIQPSTPSSTLCLKSDGKIGVGTWSPAYKFEIETTGEDAFLYLDRTDGAQFKLNVTTNQAQIGSKSNHKLNFVTNNLNRVTIDTSGNVGIGTTTPTHQIEVNNASASNAYCDGGDWVNGSSREFKENIKKLTSIEAMDTLNALNPVKYNYKFDRTEEKLGFIAEEVPELVAQNDRKSLSPMDIIAVLTRAVQEQQKTISELKEKIASLEQKVAAK